MPQLYGDGFQINHSSNFEFMEYLAKGYWNWQLPLLLKFGFPLDIKGELSDLKNSNSSHASALQFPEHVSLHLEDELGHKGIYGPLLWNSYWFTDKIFRTFRHIIWDHIGSKILMRQVLLIGVHFMMLISTWSGCILSHVGEFITITIYLLFVHIVQYVNTKRRNI